MRAASFFRKLLLAIGAGVALLGGADDANAYVLAWPYWNGSEWLQPKWGHPQTGMPGGTVTWSLMPDGTTIDPSFPDADVVHGSSTLGSLLTTLGESQALAAIERAFSHWSAVANIYFVQVDDSGLPLNDVGALPPVVGNIRIGAFEIPEIDGWLPGAFGYYPPVGDGPTHSGDIIINSLNRFQLAPGDEGDQFEVFLPPDYYFHNDFEGLLAHEIGHTLGLDHSDVPSLMYVASGDFDHVNRMPDPDDIAAVQFLYGPALAADFNHDNAVRGDDLAIWAASGLVASGATQTEGDADRDGDVDGADLLILQRELGSGFVMNGGGFATVPEPGTGLLASMGLALIAGRFRVRLRAPFRPAPTGR